MNSPVDKSNQCGVEHVPHQQNLCGISPVTDLTLNLKGLTTSLTGTPSRRISWSTPYVYNNMTACSPDGFSPYEESPTFFENKQNGSRPKVESRKHFRTLLPSESDEDKENVLPVLVSSVSRPIKSESASSIECDSQDSGYSCSADRSYGNSFYTQPRAKVRSSIFTDDDEDSLENLFDFDELDSEIVPMKDSMTNLLTKPLHDAFQSKYYPHTAKKRGKQPIRRCLSMEMDCNSNSSFHETFSQKGTYVASTSSQSEEIMEFETSNKCTFKRPDPPENYISFQSKRRKSSVSIEPSSNFVLKRSFSETATSIMQALQIAELQPELIGDCSKSYALPLVKGRHQDLKCISSQTLVKLLNDEYKDEISNYTLVDCRYPYEFEGGHIRGAKNIYTKEDILETLLKEETVITSERNIIIFHCEFSSERAPTMCRFLRNKDREKNEGSYPRLSHPEIYILEGGYKGFFEEYKEYCNPQSYKPMNHKDHGFELRHFRAKSKSWGADSKTRYKSKPSNSKQSLLSMQESPNLV